MKEYDEEDARTDPSVLIHEEKLRRTEASQQRRREASKQDREEKREESAKAKAEKKSLERHEARVKKLKSLGTSTVGFISGGVSALGKVSVKLPKGIRHPDDLVHNAEFYGMGGASRLKPVEGASYGMELYGYHRGVPRGTQEVYTALMQGYREDQLAGVTGLSQSEVNQSLRYLAKKKMIDIEED